MRLAMNLAQSLLYALRDHGARQIFGIPGDFVLPLFKEIETSGILPLYTLSHEPGVGFAADGAARISGQLGVAAVTYGAGALNMVNAIAGAYAEKSPVVVISGGPGRGESASGLLLHHQAKRLDSQALVYREITCAQTRLDDAERAPAEIARVLACCRHESRPVYIEVPRDMSLVDCKPVIAAPPMQIDDAALEACVDEIFARLRASNAPALMIGVEVRRFGQEAKLAELARRLNIPVVTSLMGCGLLADTDRPPVGIYLGVAGEPNVTALVENADTLFLLGVILSDTNLGVSGKKIDLRRAIIAGDGQVSLGYHVYAGIPLAALIEGLLAKTLATATVLAEESPSVDGCDKPRWVADAGPITSNDITLAINDLMARRGRMPLSVDVGDCLFTSLSIDHSPRVAPGYYATMGFAVPAGLGVQATSGERPMILLGDGAFQMTGWELGNCRRYGWDPIVVVFNNAGWGMLQCFEPDAAFNHLGEWQFASMAAGMGGDGVRVTTNVELRAALEHAWATRGRFQLIEVMLQDGVRSSMLDKYVAGVRALSAPRAAERR